MNFLNRLIGAATFLFGSEDDIAKLINKETKEPVEKIEAQEEVHDTKQNTVGDNKTLPVSIPDVFFIVDGFEDIFYVDMDMLNNDKARTIQLINTDDMVFTDAEYSITEVKKTYNMMDFMSFEYRVYKKESLEKGAVYLHRIDDRQTVLNRKRKLIRITHPNDIDIITKDGKINYLTMSKMYKYILEKPFIDTMKLAKNGAILKDIIK